MTVSRILLISSFTVGLGLLLHIVGTSTPHWIDLSNSDDNRGNIGLFKQCMMGKCVDMSNPPSELKVAQAMAILGVLAGGAGAAAVVAFVNLTYRGRHPVVLLRVASGILCVAASLFIFVGIGVFGRQFYDKNKGPTTSFGYSFALTLTGGLLLLPAGVVLMAIKGSEDERFTS